VEPDIDVQRDDFDLDVSFESLPEGDLEGTAALKPSIASECCTPATGCS
jgi:hypothetical protein